MTEVEYLSLPDLFVSEREREADRATWKEMKSDICYDSGSSFCHAVSGIICVYVCWNTSSECLVHLGTQS